MGQGLKETKEEKRKRRKREERRAKKAREAARQHLVENSCGPAYDKDGNEKRPTGQIEQESDNTLELLAARRARAKKAEEDEASLRAQAAAAQAAKAKAIASMTAAPLAADEEGAVPAGWAEVRDEETLETYYYDTINQKATWDRPSAPAVSLERNESELIS